MSLYLTVLSPYSFPSVFSNLILPGPWWRRQDLLALSHENRKARLTPDLGHHIKVSVWCVGCGWDRTQDGGRYLYGRIRVCGVFDSRRMSHLFRRQHSEVVGGCLVHSLRGWCTEVAGKFRCPGFHQRSTPLLDSLGSVKCRARPPHCVQASLGPSKPNAPQAGCSSLPFPGLPLPPVRTC